MPNRVLGLALSVSLAVAARTTAKPPDLPQPTTAEFKTSTQTIDFVPFVEPISAVPFSGGEESEPATRIDIEAAKERMSRCLQFSICPLSALTDWFSVWLTTSPFVKTEYAGLTLPAPHYLEHPPEYTPTEAPPFPYARELAALKAQSAPEKLSDAPREVSECPFVKAKQEKAAKPKKPSKAEVSKKVHELRKLAKLFDELGFVSDACDAYSEIVRLAPRTKWAREASARKKVLTSTPKTTPATESTEESEKPKTGLRAPTIQDIATLSRSGTPDNIIINQIQTTGAVYPNLTSADITYLRENAVSSNVILVMQGTAEPSKAIVGGLEAARQEIERVIKARDSEEFEQDLIKAHSRPVIKAEPRTYPPTPVQESQVFGSYDISDLVGQKSGRKVSRTKTEMELAREMVQFIRSHFEPASWKGTGGSATIEYRPETNSLVVQNSDAVQEQVAGLLESLREKQKEGEPRGQWISSLTQKMRGGEEDSSPRKEAKAEPKMAMMGLDIRDLLTSHEVSWDRSTDALKVVSKYDPEGMSTELIRLIENGIASDSWLSRGGSGRIDYNPELTTLFVTNSEQVLEDVATLIQSRRRELQLQKERCEQEVREGTMKRQVRWGSPKGKLFKPVSMGFDFGKHDVWMEVEDSAPEVLTAKLIDALLQESHDALEKGERQRAESLVSCALLMDRKAVMEHPLVYKMQLLTQVMPEAKRVQMTPRMPAVDPGIVRAYTEILDGSKPYTIQVIRRTPVTTRPGFVKPVKPVVLEVNQEECELEVVKPGKKDSSCCMECDVEHGRFRFQVQMGSWTFKMVDEGKGKSFTMSLKCLDAKK